MEFYPQKKKIKVDLKELKYKSPLVNSVVLGMTGCTGGVDTQPCSVVHFVVYISKKREFKDEYDIHHFKPLFFLQKICASSGRV